MSYFGIYQAVCTNALDPEGLFRVRVSNPQLFGTGESAWAWPCVPPGWFEGLMSNHVFTDDADVPSTKTLVHTLKRTVPKLGEPVWVMFESGQLEKPVWMGTWRTNG